MVIHYTAMASTAEARARLCDPAAEVSAHWLIDPDGGCDLLVEEGLRAWHAGAGAWGGVTDVNSRSIGIELQNSGDAPFPEAQMAALERLVASIMARWSIPPERVIGHSDMAPQRKRDPGPRFDWRRLALAGLSVWHGPGGDPVADFIASARAFGYPEAPGDVLLSAMRQRFRPGAAGAETSEDRRTISDLARRFPCAGCSGP